MIELDTINNKKEIILCPACKGSGKDWHTIRISGHNEEREERPCSLCRGCGRMRQITTMQLFPFENNSELHTPGFDGKGRIWD